MITIKQEGNSAYIEVSNGWRTYRIKVSEHSEGIEIQNQCDQVYDSQKEKHGSCVYRNKTDRDRVLFSNTEGKCCWKEYEPL